jgi:hypothetical protein
MIRSSAEGFQWRRAVATFTAIGASGPKARSRRSFRSQRGLTRHTLNRLFHFIGCHWVSNNFINARAHRVSRKLGSARGRQSTFLFCGTWRGSPRSLAESQIVVEVSHIADALRDELMLPHVEAGSTVTKTGAGFNVVLELSIRSKNDYPSRQFSPFSAPAPEP